MNKVLLCKGYSKEALELINSLRADGEKVVIYKYNPPTLRENKGYFHRYNRERIDIIDSMTSVKTKADKYYICNAQADKVLSKLLIDEIRSFTAKVKTSFDDVELYKVYTVNKYRNFGSIV